MAPHPQSNILGIAVPRGFLRLLCLFALLLSALVNSGDFGTVDTLRRLQQTRALWTSSPEVRPGDAGIRTPGGLRTLYGLGQPLLFLPADILSAPIAHLPVTDHVAQGARIVFIGWFAQSLTTAAALMFAYLLLRRLGFAHRASALGTLSLPLLTTFLHYVQVVQENNLMLTLALAGTFFTATWLDTRRTAHAALAGAAFGYAFFTRITTAGDTGAGLLFLLLCLGPARALTSAYLRGFLPPFTLFAAAERLYHFARFGSWFTTSQGIQASQVPPGVPDFKFSYSFLKGLAMALWSPDNSIFLFDPLLPLVLVLLLLSWRRMEPRQRAFALSALASLAVYLCFYARYFTPTGKASWGDRYTQTPVHLLCLLVVPLLLTHWRTFAPALRGAACLVLVGSFVQQTASILLNMAVEVDQVRRLGDPWVIPRRFHNIWLVLTNRAAEAPSMRDLPPEWRTLNLLPFQLTLRFPALARLAILLWCALLAAILALLLRIKRLLSSTSPAGTSG